MIVDMTKFACGYCKRQIESNDDAKMCPHCNVVLHKRCWAENKGCTTPGCKGRHNASATAQSKPTPIPIAANKLDPFSGLDRKQEEQAIALLQRYGLDRLENVDDIRSVQKITAELCGTGLLEAGMAINALIGDRSVNAAEQTQTYYQRALVEQNWIIIRQLDRLNSSITRLLEK